MDIKRLTLNSAQVAVLAIASPSAWMVTGNMVENSCWGRAVDVAVLVSIKWQYLSCNSTGNGRKGQVVLSPLLTVSENLIRLVESN